MEHDKKGSNPAGRISFLFCWLYTGVMNKLEKNIKIAVLKAKSPSCGKNHIYDGTFSHQLVEGDGIFVQVLKEKGIAVYSENEVTEVLKLINGGK